MYLTTRTTNFLLPSAPLLLVLLLHCGLLVLLLLHPLHLRLLRPLYSLLEGLNVNLRELRGTVQSYN